MNTKNNCRNVLKQAENKQKAQSKHKWKFLVLTQKSSWFKMCRLFVEKLGRPIIRLSQLKTVYYHFKSFFKPSNTKV